MCTKVNEFKIELAALLQKYNAEIYSDLEGDTHGVTCSLIIDIDNKEVMKFDNPASISQYDLK